ncbi:ribosome small subunit-dependent GTPase A [Lignipirellula cremea]|nr:ribosome small subunit-dependent GTPase A [Lignipirellula cremea]
MAKKKKIRTEFRKKYGGRSRDGDLTRDYKAGGENADAQHSERISGKGSLTRHRTITGGQTEAEETAFAVELSVDEAQSKQGRVLSIHGLNSFVMSDDGIRYQCSTRGLLKSLNTDQRNVIAVGDRVSIRVVSEGEGVIDRIEPRRGVISRTSRGRQHVIVANVDQLLIITSAAEPGLKPNLVDRFLLTAEKSHIRPIICINKVDLIDPADLQPLIGVYSQMGYRVLLMSAATGVGVDRLRQLTAGKQSVVAGQSGVGKSSLLNSIESGLALRVQTVSQENQKGRHTTTAGKLIPLSMGGYVVDTPGIRQFELWDVIPQEVAGFYPDIRPFVSLCRFPDCTHTHEADCAVKHAVGDGRLDARRYESYRYLFEGEMV